MNRKDCEMYMNYKDEKRNLFKQNMINFENDKKKLNDKYKENISKIEEIEYILENKAILPKTIVDSFLLIVLELVVCQALVLCNKEGCTFLELATPMIIFIAINIIIGMLAIDIKKGAECQIKYKKMIKK